MLATNEQARATRRAALTRAAVAVPLLAACGQAAALPGRPPALAGKATMLLWAADRQLEVHVQAMAPFNQKYAPAAAEIVSVPGGYYGGYGDKLEAMTAAGTPPDIFIIPDSVLPGFLTRKLALDLEPLVRRDRYDLSDFPRGAIDAYRYRGGLYGLPHNITSEGLLWNVELFRQAGAKPPALDPNDRSWNLQAFLQAAQQLARLSRAEASVFGVLPSYALIGVIAWLRSNGGDLVDRDVTELRLTEGPVLEALQMLADLRHKYRVAPTPEDLRAQNALQLFVGGRLGMWEVCICQVGRLREQAQFEWDAAYRPLGKGGRVDHLYAFPLLIAAGTRLPDVGWAALRFFQDEALIELVKFGGLQGTKMQAHQRKFFVDPAKPPKHAEVLVASVERFGRLPPATTNWREVERVLAEELAPLWNGQRTAREAATAAKARVDPLLKEAKQQGR